jgi:catechol 2,3-dioxygenase-like lactoylglutathione lyase family enzyme
MSGTSGAWAWHHTGIAVSSIDETLELYHSLLGFEIVFEARGMTDLIRSMTGVPTLVADLVQCRSAVSGQVLEFIEFSGIPSEVDPRLPLQPGRAHTAFLVADIERAVFQCERAGGEQLGQITEFSEGRAVYCADRFGTVIEWEEASEEMVS